MTDLVNYPEMAIDINNRHFATHPDMELWLVQMVTTGHSFDLGPNGSPLYLPRDVSLPQLREATNNRVGLMKLVQCTKDGDVLPGPVAYMQIHSGDLAAGRQGITIEGAVALADRMARTSEQCIALMANMTNTLMTTHVQLQSGSARLLEAATGAIRVTSGIERIERDRPIDVDTICERLIDAIDEREPETPPPPEHWVVQLANGKLGQSAMLFMSQYAQALAREHAKRQAKADSESDE